MQTWVYLLMLFMIAGTVCAAILAVIGIILVVVLVALAVVAAVLAYLIRSMKEGQALSILADKVPEEPTGRRRR